MQEIKHLKELISNIDSYELLIFLSTQKEQNYTKITSLLSRRLKTRFEINYEVIKAKTFDKSELELILKKLEPLNQALEAFKLEELENDEEYEEDSQPLSIEYYISSFLNFEAKRYNGLNTLLEDCINEFSLDDISAVELISKIESIKFEARSYFNKEDYLNYQLPKLIELEQNHLFKSIFKYVKQNEYLNETIIANYNLIIDEYLENIKTTTKLKVENFYKLEYEDYINQLEKKVEIIRYGLLTYLAYLCEVTLGEPKLYYEKKVQTYFEPEIREELFEYIDYKLNSI